MEDVMDGTRGINVIHDKTMHRQTFLQRVLTRRSLETIQKAYEKIPYGQIRDRPATEMQLPMR